MALAFRPFKPQAIAWQARSYEKASPRRSDLVSRWLWLFRPFKTQAIAWQARSYEKALPRRSDLVSRWLWLFRPFKTQAIAWQARSYEKALPRRSDLVSRWLWLSAQSSPKPSRGKHAPTKKLLPVGATSCRDGFGFLPIQNPAIAWQARSYEKAPPRRSDLVSRWLWLFCPFNTQAIAWQARSYEKAPPRGGDLVSRWPLSSHSD